MLSRKQRKRIQQTVIDASEAARILKTGLEANSLSVDDAIVAFRLLSNACDLVFVIVDNDGDGDN